MELIDPCHREQQHRNSVIYSRTRQRLNRRCHYGAQSHSCAAELALCVRPINVQSHTCTGGSSTVVNRRPPHWCTRSAHAATATTTILQAAEFLQNCTALVQERFPLISVHQVEAGDQAASLCSIARVTNSERLVIFADVLTKGKNHARLLKTLVESCHCRLEVIPVLPADKLASDHGYHSL